MVLTSRKIQLVCALVLLAVASASAASSFLVGQTTFLKDGQPFRVISGSLHYFRVHPDQWLDRLQKFKASGLNTVQTYVPWNLHQPKNDTNFIYEGILDVRRFIQLAAEVGLLVTVRPPPYLCAEFEFGGFPGWFMANPDIRFRTNEPIFMSALTIFMNDFLPRIADLQYHLGGPVVMFQIENEYGNYGSDWDYLKAIRNIFLSNRIDTVLITCNGASDAAMTAGNIPGLYSDKYVRTVNFGQGANVTEQFQILRRYQPTGPLFVTEYWPGWFDMWGGKHETRPGTVDAEMIDQILSVGGSVNMYMFLGGTNFGFTNGAEQDPYMPLVTSYDYDAPLDESGDPTDKFALIRAVIAKYVPVPAPIPPPGPKKNYGTVPLTTIGSLFDPRIYGIVARNSVKSAYPKTMEQLGENFGFVHYTAQLNFPPGRYKLRLATLHDSAQVFVDGNYVSSLQRMGNISTHIVVPKTGSSLDILVENLGRLKYGYDMQNEYKGILAADVRSIYVSGWTSTAIPLHDEDILRVAELPPSASGGFNPQVGQPAFFVGEFNTSAPLADTFLQVNSFVKGAVWVNGFNLGRYWCVGPQVRLYVPAPVLRSDSPNQIVLFDLYGPMAGQPLSVEFVAQPQLDGRWC